MNTKKASAAPICPQNKFDFLKNSYFNETCFIHKRSTHMTENEKMRAGKIYDPFADNDFEELGK